MASMYLRKLLGGRYADVMDRDDFVRALTVYAIKMRNTVADEDVVTEIADAILTGAEPSVDSDLHETLYIVGLALAAAPTTYTMEMLDDRAHIAWAMYNSRDVSAGWKYTRNELAAATRLFQGIASKSAAVFSIVPETLHAPKSDVINRGDIKEWFVATIERDARDILTAARDTNIRRTRFAVVNVAAVHLMDSVHLEVRCDHYNGGTFAKAIVRNRYTRDVSEMSARGAALWDDDVAADLVAATLLLWDETLPPPTADALEDGDDMSGNDHIVDVDDIQDAGDAPDDMSE